MRKSSVIVVAVERHVEVGAQQDTLAGDVAEVVEHRDARHRALAHRFLLPVYTAMSTRRLE